MTEITVGKYFCLKDRDNFDIRPERERDSELFFGRMELYAKIQSQIKKAYRENKPVKLILWGDWGVGKTHTMRHIEYFFRKNGDRYPAAVYFIDCGDVEKNTRFDALHRQILDAIGMEKIKELLDKFQREHGMDTKEELKKGVGGSTDITNAFIALMGFGTNVHTAWAWLQGADVKDQSSIGVTQMLRESKDFVNILVFIGRLFRQFDGKLPIILVDELEKVDAVEGPALTHWVHTVKDLAGGVNDSLGFIFAVAFRDIDDLPDAIADDQIISRLEPKADHYIELANLEKPEAKAFLTALLRNFVDRDTLSKLKADKHLDQIDGFDEETYPFTTGAFDTFVDFVSRDPTHALPREIIHQLEKAAYEAMDRDQKAVTEELLNELAMV